MVTCRYGAIMSSNPANVAARPTEKVPLGYRPSSNIWDQKMVFRMINNHNHTGAGVLSIAHDGSLIIEATAGGLNEVHGQITYYTDDPFPA